MTNKERRQIKTSLKTNIDTADSLIKMVLSRVDFEAIEEEGTQQTNELLVSTLKNLSRKISHDANEFLAEIDDVIKKLS